MNQPLIVRHETHPGSVRTYVLGFALSIGLTLIAYVLVADHILDKNWLIAVVIGLALTQFMVQIFFFLHLGQESKPRWKQAVFMLMIIIVLILVLGSLWIMQNLNYHHETMTPQQTDKYILKDEGAD